jgi:hypothetical protein
LKPLPPRDRGIVALIVFFMVVGWTLELYFVLFARSLGTRTDFMARLWSYYAPADHAYFDRVTREEYGLESFHVFFTQWIHAWLIYAIVKRAAYRYSLQLAVGVCVTFSTCVYLLSKHLSGYVDMTQVTTANLVMLYGANAPWALGNFYLAWDAARAIHSRFAARAIHSRFAKR